MYATIARVSGIGFCLAFLCSMHVFCIYTYIAPCLPRGSVHIFPVVPFRPARSSERRWLIGTLMNVCFPFQVFMNHNPKSRTDAPQNAGGGLKRCGLLYFRTSYRDIICAKYDRLIHDFCFAVFRFKKKKEHSLY